MTNYNERPVQGFEGLYSVSRSGLVISHKRTTTNERILKQYCSPRGYLRVKLLKNGKYHNVLVHRLVATAFISNDNHLPYINHIDADKSNNSVDNLEWCTREQNVTHAKSLKLYPGNPRKLTNAQRVNIIHMKGEMSQEKIGNLYGVSQDLVYLLHNGKVRIFI